jgi:hypothetical protein
LTISAVLSDYYGCIVEPADGSSEQPAITGNGRVVAFVSRATNLVPGDTNDVRDIFVRRILPASSSSRSSLTY